MANPAASRRRFIKTLMLGLAGGWFLRRFFTLPAVPARLLVTVADADLPQRGALVFRQQRLALIREQDQVYALSLVCTHLGCTLAVLPEALVCPCHGSRFDAAGAVQAGPASQALPRLRLQRQGDQWQVYDQPIGRG
ncbi:ubiquinol-cytochrome c reductase iron-sulfur subunit [Desulfuromonas thiophila]|uniref:QcrA and Rieske domain-containing protein n=1 Tax=Desulfuromonas thiophila TaxID=57664 RepID=UPI0024A7E9CC|nr:Rieske (2Fe-2S) protein [Desulfuromonas thiophila]